MCAMAMDAGVGLGLAMSVDRKEAEACGGEEPKDVRRGERGRGLGDPFVGDGGSARTYTSLAQFGLVVRCHEIRHRCVRCRSRTREDRRFRSCHAIVEQERRVSIPVKDAKFQKSPNKLAKKNVDMRHRPNESAHTQVQTGIRLLSSCPSRTEQKKSVAAKFMIFASPENRS